MLTSTAGYLLHWLDWIYSGLTQSPSVVGFVFYCGASVVFMWAIYTLFYYLGNVVVFAVTMVMNVFELMYVLLRFAGYLLGGLPDSAKVMADAGFASAKVSDEAWKLGGKSLQSALKPETTAALSTAVSLLVEKVSRPLAFMPK